MIQQLNIIFNRIFMTLKFKMHNRNFYDPHGAVGNGHPSIQLEHLAWIHHSCGQIRRSVFSRNFYILQKNIFSFYFFRWTLAAMRFEFPSSQERNRQRCLGQYRKKRWRYPKRDRKSSAWSQRFDQVRNENYSWVLF